MWLLVCTLQRQQWGGFGECFDASFRAMSDDPIATIICRYPTHFLWDCCGTIIVLTPMFDERGLSLEEETNIEVANQTAIEGDFHG